MRCVAPRVDLHHVGLFRWVAFPELTLFCPWCAGTVIPVPVLYSMAGSALDTVPGAAGLSSHKTS